MDKARFIALYLPQYHPTPENDAWYGKGFTEWTNVGKAAKLYPGHYRYVPGELGYYDLRLPEVREAQAQLAREHGIEGFCYYHYWFGNGVRQLQYPFEEVLKSGRPDFPFCLAWANESWHKKFWNSDGTNRQELLVEQLYPGEEDFIAHFHYCLAAFRDPRYITVDGKPLFMIYRPRKFPEVNHFIELWRRLAVENGLAGIHFVAQSTNIAKERRLFGELGFDAVNSLRMREYRNHWNIIKRFFVKALWTLLPIPKILSYPDISRYFIGPEDEEENVYPSVIPNWDHTPRSGRGGSVWIKALPNYFGKHVARALKAVARKSPQHRIIFIKSWNEWGEGNYMEPDLRFGRGYLEELRRAQTSKE